MDKKIIGNKYQVLRVLFDNENYYAAICRDISTPDEKHSVILNVYRSKPSILKAAPVFTKVNSDICHDFKEFFVESPYVISVFKHYDYTSLECFLSENDISLTERLALCSSFLLEAIRNDNIPLLLKLDILQAKHIVVDSERKIHINFFAKLDNNDEPEIIEKKVIKNISSIIELILGNRKKLPEELLNFLSELESDKYNMISSIFSEFNTVSEAIIAKTEDSSDQNLQKRARTALGKAVKKQVKKPAAIIVLRVVVIVLLAGIIIAGGYYAYKHIFTGKPVASFSEEISETNVIDNAMQVKLSPKTPAVSESVPEPSPVTVEPEKNNEVVHIVKIDDNLFDIAEAYYGNGDLYTLIKERNKLESNIIYVGMELIIPAYNQMEQ
ncbi:MAG: LysM peptidoglycan-binding domain-containing protein [Acetivibrionales bacterium]